MALHKTDIANDIAEAAGLTKSAASDALDAAIKSITKGLKAGESVTLIGFGTFKVVKRKARKGRNPQTGAEIQIAASTTAKFSAGKGLKDELN